MKGWNLQITHILIQVADTLYQTYYYSPLNTPEETDCTLYLYLLGILLEFIKSSFFIEISLQNFVPILGK